MNMTLLIVDDSELIQASLRGLLEGIQGIEAIHTAGTLAQALKSIRRDPPTLAILDLHLPDGNAIPIITLLKKMAPGMQIAVLTNDASEFNRKKCLHGGVDWFFDKSKEFEKLLEVIQDLAAHRSAPKTITP